MSSNHVHNKRSRDLRRRLLLRRRRRLLPEGLFDGTSTTNSRKSSIMSLCKRTTNSRTPKPQSYRSVYSVYSRVTAVFRVFTAELQQCLLCLQQSYSSVYSRATAVFTAELQQCLQCLQQSYSSVYSENDATMLVAIINFITPRQNLEFSERNFFYCGAQTWNDILLHIRVIPTITLFKKKLRIFLHS